jgi:hypothetical protein
VSCSAAVSNKFSPLKNVFPKKRSVYERKPNRFHPAFNERRSYATRQAETGSHMSEWLRSPELQPPK